MVRPSLKIFLSGAQPPLTSPRWVGPCSVRPWPTGTPPRWLGMTSTAPPSLRRTGCTPIRALAAVVAADLERGASQGRPRPLELVVAGGGGRNPVLMQELRQRCRGIRVDRSDRLSLPVESREAVVFALLAWWHWQRHPGNAPAVTGASRRVVLGQRAEPS